MSNVPTKRLGRRSSVTTLSNFSSTDSSQGLEGNRTKISTHSAFLGEQTQGSETIFPQQRWKNKSFSQPHSLNRMSQNRLRASHSQEVLSELRNRRKLRPSKRRPSQRKASSPLERFRRIVLLVRLLIRCLLDYRRITLVSHANQMSFAMLSNDLVSTRSYGHGLTFDPNDYKVAKETPLTDKLRSILTLVPFQRTKQQLEYALKCLRAGVEEFAEFPLSMQHALVKVAWLDEFEPKRIIIRQGHKAETFYFIISGTALVTKNRINSTGEGYVETVSILKRGKSFGELAIMRHEQRTNNVVSQTHISLLTVGRKDFVEIFMHRMDGGEPEFISFLRKLPELKGFPLGKIPRNKPKICAFTYFRVGVVICPDSDKSDTIVIVRSGVCRVVKLLNATKPNLPGLQELSSNLAYETPMLHRISSLPNSAIGIRQSAFAKSSTSRFPPLTGPKYLTLSKKQNLSLMPERGLSFNDSLMKLQPWSEKNFRTRYEDRNEHEKSIWKDYLKWQEDHPISRETFALLMTGKESEEENIKFHNGEKSEKRSDYKDRLDSCCLGQEGAVLQNGERQCCKASMQENIPMLKRSRANYPDVTSQRRVAKVPPLNTNSPKLVENVLSQSTSSNRFSSGRSISNKTVYIHVQTLREKDVFGLLPVVFDKSEGATSVSLISDGAECILINKDFFIKHFDDEQRERLVRMISPYPSDGTLQANLQNQTNWDAYKLMTVRSHVEKRENTKQQHRSSSSKIITTIVPRQKVVV